MQRAGIAAGVGILLALALWWMTPGPDTGAEVDPRVAPLLKALNEPQQVQVADDVPPPEPARWRPVSCPLTVDIVGYKKDLRVLMFEGPEPAEIVSVAADVQNYELKFQAPVDDGAALVELYGYERAPVVWWTEEDGATSCAFARDPAPAPMAKVTLSIALPDNADYDDIYVTGCGVPMRVDWAAEAHVAEYEPGECAFTACRRHLRMGVCGETVAVELTVERPVALTLDVPDFVPAGLALDFGYREDGLEILAVPGGSVAEAAEMELGDMIVAIDGEVLADMNPGQRRNAIAGPEGSVAALEVRSADGELYEVQVERQFVPK